MKKCSTCNHVDMWHGIHNGVQLNDTTQCHYPYCKAKCRHFEPKIPS